MLRTQLGVTKTVEFSSAKDGGVWFALALDEKNRMIACSFSKENRAKAETAVIRMVASHGRFGQKRTTFTRARLRNLYELYTGRGKAVRSSLDLSHVSPFRQRVYDLLLQIPRGRVTTYGTIAKKLASQRYARAVGAAVGSNPMLLVIPCHRVVPSTLKVGNYGLPGRKPREGTPVKRELLEREGVKFNGNKISNKSLWYPK